MTQQEAREISGEKIKKLKALAKELQIVIDAKQMLVGGKFLETTVIFTDMEKYDISSPISEKQDDQNSIPLK